ncbi:MAG TPA: phosphatidylcholine/phosphatidylserine synthase [Pyrinomonadaceae bacterium]|jgi:CDP-diacylglycerol--serine O-phosphatidyltransferase|nr:phosphatidylcholine/phosphatidylserine synthase [Pyrinomonadaceae bacterium]
MADDDYPGADARPERKGLKKGLYLLPSAFTAANIGMGYYAVMGALKGFQMLDGAGDAELARAASMFDNASRAIGWAVLFDALDGRIARLTKTTTEIGVQLDSIADVVTFGIAPAVLIYAWGYGAAFAEGSQLHKLGWFVSFMFLICGALRLARFNVQATRPRTLAEGTGKVDKKNFVGLPIPAAAGLLAALVHFAPAPLVSYGGYWSSVYAGTLMVLVPVLAVLMVSTIRYSSFKTFGAGKRSTITAMPIIAAVGMLVWLFSRYVLLAFIAAYVLHGILFRLASLFRTRPQPEGA